MYTFRHQLVYKICLITKAARLPKTFVDICVVYSACKLAPTVQFYVTTFVYFWVSYKPKH